MWWCCSHSTLREGPPIIYGKNPTDLPNYELGEYETGHSSILGCYSGPNGGLTTVRRTEKHLSVPDPDIDFIDTQDENGGEDPSDPSALAPADDSSLPEEWSRKSELVYGVSDSLYDRNQVTDNKNGDPIADCFGVISRQNSAIVAVADGVNWGEKASIAAKSAVHGSLHYLNKTIFNDTRPFDSLTIKGDETSGPSAGFSNRVANTREIFVCLLRAFSCAHDLILENQGMLTTLTVAVVLPLKRRDDAQRYVCCVCNVGDTLAYVYSQRHGLRELTKGSHDINCNRDMRDALGALGPVDGINPELSNLTLSVTTLNKGDIVMVASDGLTDNFDPNVCRFTVNSRLGEAPSRVRRTPSTTEPPVKPPRRSQNKNAPTRGAARTVTVAENKTSSLRKQISSQQKQETSKTANKSDTAQGYKFLRSKTTIEVRAGSGGISRQIARNEDGIPYVTPLQRYELQLLLIEDVLKNGISGRDQPCTTAKKLCENLVSFTFSITSAKRHTLEDQELYFDNRNGVLVEVSQQEKKIRRKRGLEKVQNLPGKLDHVTVVAWNVGNCQ
jgi:serine/threonine protein phosphatase PrpC